MFSKFQIHQNSIITGSIDAFCLVCESHLRCEDDTRHHIEKPVHRKNLEATPYFDRYKDEHVRKVKRGYFCEFCNLLTATAAKVGLHIADPPHINNKGIQSLRRVGNAVVAFKDVYIDERAWQGLIEDTCVLCNEEFHNELIHKTQSSHILNLVQMKVEFGDGEAIFRRMDDGSFQCLTCNSMFSTDAIKSHFTLEDHLEALRNCRLVSLDNNNSINEAEGGKRLDKENVAKPAPKTQNETFDTASATDKQDLHKSMELANNRIDNAIPLKSHIDQDKESNNKIAGRENDISKIAPEKSGDYFSKSNTLQQNKALILDNVPEFQKSGVTVNFENDTAFCKWCFENVDLTFEDIKQHIAGHKYKEPNREMATPVLDQNNCRMELKSTDKDQSLDQNHNITKTTKIGLANGVTDASNSIVPYIPLVNEAKATETKTAPAPEETNDPAIYAKLHKLTFNRSNSDAYCRMCKVKLPSSMKSMREHVNGAKHKKSVKLFEQDLQQCLQCNKSTSRRKFMHFLQTMYETERFGTEEVVINEKYCISRLSFFMITKQMDRLRCQICEANVYAYQVENHTARSSHEEAMDETPVVLSLEDEFMRELRPGLFHCGYCNLIAGDWDDVGRHLACDDHRKNKMAAASRLRAHMPYIEEMRRREEEHIMRLVMGRLGFGFFR